MIAERFGNNICLNTVSWYRLYLYWLEVPPNTQLTDPTNYNHGKNSLIVPVSSIAFHLVMNLLFKNNV